MKDHYRKIVNLMRDKAPDFASFEEMILILKHANIEDVAVINEVVSELACDQAQELCDGIRVIR